MANLLLFIDIQVDTVKAVSTNPKLVRLQKLAKWKLGKILQENDIKKNRELIKERFYERFPKVCNSWLCNWILLENVKIIFKLKPLKICQRFEQKR